YDRHRSVRLVVLVGLAIDQIAQSGLSSLSVIYYSAQLFRPPTLTLRKKRMFTKYPTADTPSDAFTIEPLRAPLQRKLATTVHFAVHFMLYLT
ncbi:hypothetical protein, partial [Klebsiella pneumoniae]